MIDLKPARLTIHLWFAPIIITLLLLTHNLSSSSSQHPFLTSQCSMSHKMLEEKCSQNERDVVWWQKIHKMMCFGGMPGHNSRQPRGLGTGFEASSFASSGNREASTAKHKLLHSRRAHWKTKFQGPAYQTLARDKLRASESGNI